MLVREYRCRLLIDTAQLQPIPTSCLMKSPEYHG